MTTTASNHRIRKVLRRRTWKPIPRPLRYMACLLMISQLILPVYPQLLYAAESALNEETLAGIAPTQSKMPPPAPEVIVNRTVPNVDPPCSDIQFSTTPTDAEIAQAHIFAEPLAPMNKTTPQENQDLAQALTAFLQRSTNDDFGAVNQFLDSHPQSAWRASLLTELGLAYLHAGSYSKALVCWEEAWKLAKKETDPKTKIVADRALAELLEINLHLGRHDRLEALLGETQGRVFCSAVSEKITGAREGFWYTQNRPEAAFRCGPMALSRIRAFQRSGSDTDRLIKNSHSTVKGLSLSGVCDLANRLGMNYQMARRKPASQVLLPAVVHWKVGHYAALVKEENGSYLVQDPAFGGEHWVSPVVLDAEASGYFLVPAGDLPQGWSSVDIGEGQNVWGKGPTGQNDTDATKPTDEQNPACPDIDQDDSPMARYAFHAMLVSLHIVDTPVGYTPPRGPDVHFQVTYNQREANQPTTFRYSNLGPKWTFNWLSYISDTPGHPEYGVQYYVQGGGTEAYPASSYNSTTKTFAADPATHATLKVASPTNYVRLLPDGSQQFFTVPNAPTNATSRQVFLTKIMDASSNSLTFTYDSHYRLMAVADALGQVTTISYGSTDTNSLLFYEITKVTDPFGRSAVFTYNSSNELASITDIIGITSQFNYTLSDAGTFDFINTLITPYGTNTFAEGSSSNSVNGNIRWLTATDPLGQQEREEFDEDSTVISPTDPPNIVPASTNRINGYLQYRNTFYWDKKAMQSYTGSSSDYTNLARIQHWLHTDDYSTCTGIEESTKAPLECRIWNTYAGQPDSMRLGTNNSPATVARVLDDGSSQLYQYDYNVLGKVTRVIDPTNRTTKFAYAANNIDLLNVSQMTGATSSNVLGQFTYNLRHLPLTIVDAAGKTQSFGYNTNGQLTGMTNALGEITLLTYNTNSCLTQIVSGKGTLLATNSFTYDGYGRVRTVTDPLGYTVTTSYDAANRATNVFFMDGSYEQVVYNYLDPVMKKDRNGHWTAQVYDPLRHLTDTYDNLGRHTQFSWCGCGSLDSITDPLGRVTSWVRDLQGRVQTKIYPDTTQINYNYETNTSRLKIVTDAKKQSTVYNYFIDNNLQQVSYSNAIVATPPVLFTYDTNYNRLVTMTDGTGVTTYRYYAVSTGQFGAGMLSSISNSFIGSTGVIAYNYDALGRITNRAINNVSQQLTFDALHRVIIITNALGRFTNTYVGATMLIATNFAPYGKKTVFSYLSVTNDERLSEIWNQKTNGVTLSKFDYAYDAYGLITNWIQQADAATPTVYNYGYDAGNQIMSAVLKSTGVGATVLRQYSYGYDLAGNRTSEQIGGATIAPVAVSQSSFNNANQLTSRSSSGGPVQFAGSLDKQGTVMVAGSSATMNHQTTNFVGYPNVGLGTNIVPVVATDYGNHSRTNNYQLVVTNNGVAETITYDPNGNETNVVTATSTTSYKWDAANRLVCITGPTNQSVFTYDGSGRRVQIVESNSFAITTNKFLWDGQVLAEMRDFVGSTVVKRFFGDGEQISGTNYYFTCDHLGSVREMVDSTGAIRFRGDYDPYGRQTKLQGDLNPDFGYAGMFYHSSSGLNLTLYRAYDANLGRWLSHDPLAEKVGLNLYAYVFNNPINKVDPFGEGAIDRILIALIVAYNLYTSNPANGLGSKPLPNPTLQPTPAPPPQIQAPYTAPGTPAPELPPIEVAPVAVATGDAALISAAVGVNLFGAAVILAALTFPPGPVTYPSETDPNNPLPNNPIPSSITFPYNDSNPDIGDSVDGC